jgi:hypothetical protein
MGIYADAAFLEWFAAEYPRRSKARLDMGRALPGGLREGLMACQKSTDANGCFDFLSLIDPLRRETDSHRSVKQSSSEVKSWANYSIKS